VGAKAGAHRAPHPVFIHGTRPFEHSWWTLAFFFLLLLWRRTSAYFYVPGGLEFWIRGENE
jgi:hypothetical protein